MWIIWNLLLLLLNFHIIFVSEGQGVQYSNIIIIIIMIINFKNVILFLCGSQRPAKLHLSCGCLLAVFGGLLIPNNNKNIYFICTTSSVVFGSKWQQRRAHFMYGVVIVVRIFLINDFGLEILFFQVFFKFFSYFFVFFWCTFWNDVFRQNHIILIGFASLTEFCVFNVNSRVGLF